MESPAVSIGPRSDFALALSGGGVRAMVFHLGVLKYLAEQQALERVTQISTVSGGSLLVGLMLHENQGQWPDSVTFMQHIYPALQAKLCSRSLLWSALRQLCNPLNWRFLLSRANLLALALQKEWGVSALLPEIAAKPDWSINGTTAENGKRFRFKRNTMGDYSIGYASTSGFPLAQALAVSAAFPGGIGPLSLKTRRFKWMQREWEAPLDSAVEVRLPFKKLRLYDGGVYDNLGLEPFFDAATGQTKRYEYPIIVSDAGAPLKPGFDAGVLSPWRLKRLADIMSDQTRALRSRTFVEYLKKASGRGGYLSIASALIEPFKGSDAAFAAGFPTTLNRLKPEVFERIARHGYAVAQATDREYPLLPVASSRTPEPLVLS